MTDDTPMADGPMHATLLTNVAKWADALDPEDPYNDDPVASPALRLASLAKDAAGPFPVFVIAHRCETRDRRGDIVNDAFFETRRFDDAQSLVDWLAELEVMHDVTADNHWSTVEIVRLARRGRIDDDGDLVDDLFGHEEEVLWGRVKLKVDDVTDRKRKAEEVKAQARRVADAESTRRRELAKLAELRAKYGN